LTGRGFGLIPARGLGVDLERFAQILQRQTVPVDQRDRFPQR
jgi:hypothetical protein